MSKKFILDPLWLNKGTYLDAEYFNYLLLAACVKYKAELEKMNIDRFDEILYHVLNLNSLTVNGDLFTPKFKKIANTDRLKEIKNNLKHVYDLDQQTVEIFKNANYVFLNLLLDYINIQLDVLDQIDILYKNKKIHLEKNVFIVTTSTGSKHCTVWRMTEDLGKNFGYNFTKEVKINLPDIKENVIVKAIKQVEGENISHLINGKNILIAITDKANSDVLLAKIIKDIILLNKGISKGEEFEPTVLNELYETLWFDKVLPFTLDQWAPTEC
jgi:hypothetical protein